MKFIFAILILSLLGSGCTTRSSARLKAQNAFLAGQNMALQQQAQMAMQGSMVMVHGAVQNPQVPWVAGLTLTQAVATANYIGEVEPRQIILTRAGESVALEAKVLLNGVAIPLEAGDVIELR